MALQSVASKPSARATSSRWTKLASAVCLGAAAGLLVAGPAVAQSYPSHAIKLISPFSAGSPPDLLARLAGRQMSQRLGQTVTVENRPGAGSTIATKAVATAEPDGYTLLLAASALLYSTVLYPNAGYDPLKSFVPVAALASWSHILVVPASLPVGNVRELIAYAKAHPGEVNIGFPLGTTPHILSELFKSASGAPLNSVPYRQMAQLRSDLLADRIQAYFGAGAGLIAMIKQGKLKALVFTGATRHPALPQVPTAGESGLPQLRLNPSDWTGILAPAGTPSEAIRTLNAAVDDGLKAPDVQAALRREGEEAMAMTPAQFAIFLAAEAKKWPPLVKTAGIVPR
jgi:tripartite-type tricarboxylate transporter receptor subunit TctC